MANFQGHLIAGAVTGDSIDIIRKVKDNKPIEPRDIVILCAEVCLGAAGGILPDRLEPATSPTTSNPHWSSLEVYVKIWRRYDYEKM